MGKYMETDAMTNTANDTAASNQSAPFYLKLGKMSSVNLEQLMPHFENLPENEYKDGDYRLRRFSAFTFAGNEVNKLPHRAFNQSSELNKFMGDVERHYEDIEVACYESEGFHEMFAQFYHHAELPLDTEVEVHQMRMRAKPNQTIMLTPEGVHQDGFKCIGMYYIHYENLTGGELKVHETQDGKPFFEYLFKDGEFVVLNDQQFWHSANDVTANDNEGHMDVFIITGGKIK